MSVSAFFSFEFAGSVKLAITLLPEFFEFDVTIDFLTWNGSAAPFSQHPFQVMNDCQHDFKHQDWSGINTDSEQHQSFFGLSRHEKVNVQEDKGEQSIIEQPTLWK